MERCISPKCKLLLYADDSVIIHSSKNVDEINVVLSQEMDKMYQWLIDNKLSLHLGKTESMLFGTRTKLKEKSELNVECQGKTIQTTCKMKYLGVVFDQDLTGKFMANSVLSKVGRGLKILYRKAKYFDYEERKMVCTALLQSHFDYGCHVWYRGLTKALKSKIQCAQNKMMRYILAKDNRFHLSHEHFEQLKLLSVERRIEYLTLSSTFNIYNKTAPSYMIAHFSGSEHSHNTRHHNGFILPCVQTNGHHSFIFNAIKSWNSINMPIPTKVSHFKSECKKLLMSKMKLEEEDAFVYL